MSSGHKGSIGRTGGLTEIAYFCRLIFMQRILTPKKSGHVTYLRWPMKLLLSIITAHLVTVEGQPKSSWQLFHQLNYWVAMAFSVLAAFLLIQLVHFITMFLDRRFDWIKAWLPRLLLQVLLGIVLVLALDILFVRMYFRAFNSNFETSGYMTVEFPIIKWMVFSLNMLYVARYFLWNYIRSSRVNDELSNQLSGFYQIQEEKEGYQRTIEAKLGNKIVNVSPTEVICFEREENVGYVWMTDGRKYNVDHKMQELAQMLDPMLFYQISRSVMVSLAAIKGYEKVKNQQGNLILKDGLEADVSLLVSRYRFDGFRELFERLRSN
jgi:hypothetical protein